MNLQEKKREFASRPIISAEFHGATQSFDQDEVRRGLQGAKQQQANIHRLLGSTEDSSTRLALHMHYGRAAQLEIDERRLEMLDTPFRCDVTYYRQIIELMGFEQIGQYDVINQLGQMEQTYIHARPDGLIISWDTYHDSSSSEDVSVSSATMYFQWVGRGEHRHPGLGVSGNFECMPDKTYAYVGSIDVVEGVRDTIDTMLERGEFLSPVQFHNRDYASRRFVTSHDYYAIRAIYGDDCPLAIKDDALYQIECQRYAEFPLWVKEMVKPPVAFKPCDTDRVAPSP